MASTSVAANGMAAHRIRRVERTFGLSQTLYKVRIKETNMFNSTLSREDVCVTNELIFALVKQK
jgi:hypothetical protein